MALLAIRVSSAWLFIAPSASDAHPNAARCRSWHLNRNVVIAMVMCCNVAPVVLPSSKSIPSTTGPPTMP